MPLYQGKQRVCPIITVGVTPVLADLTVVPSTITQTITPQSDTDGYGTITVNAVTSAIDTDIKSSNIKSGITILGVAGNLTPLSGETQTVSLTSSAGNTFTPSNGKNGITSITVTPTNSSLNVVPTTTSQTFNLPANSSGFYPVTCAAVTSSIDSNIKATNIKSGVSILGVAGNVIELKGQTKTVLVDSSTPSTITIIPDSGYNGLTSVTVDLSYIEYRLNSINGNGTVDVIVPVGTYTITENGIYNIATYENVEVDIDTEQLTNLTNALESIKSVLTNLGITVTTDYSDLAGIINDSYTEILEELQRINSGDFQ